MLDRSGAVADRCVLIATDERMFRRIVGAMVDDAGFRVQIAQRSESGRHAVARAAPIVVICDGASTSAAVQRLVEAARARGVPILELRGEAKVDRSPEAAGHETSYLGFPVSRLRFIAAIDALLPPAVLTLHSADSIPRDRATSGRDEPRIRRRPGRRAAAGQRPLRARPSSVLRLTK